MHTLFNRVNHLSWVSLSEKYNSISFSFFSLILDGTSLIPNYLGRALTSHSRFSSTVTFPLCGTVSPWFSYLVRHLPCNFNQYLVFFSKPWISTHPSSGNRQSRMVWSCPHSQIQPPSAWYERGGQHQVSETNQAYISRSFGSLASRCQWESCPDHQTRSIQHGSF